MLLEHRQDQDQDQDQTDLGVVEVGGELHEDGGQEGRHVVGEGLHEGA